MHEGRHVGEAWRRDVARFVVSILAFACVATAIASCGDEDLIFPGELPTATSRPEPTDTPDAEA